MRVMMRFLTLVALPALLATFLTWTASDGLHEDARDRSLQRLAVGVVALLPPIASGDEPASAEGVLSAVLARTDVRVALYRDGRWVGGDSAAPVALSGAEGIDDRVRSLVYDAGPASPTLAGASLLLVERHPDTAPVSGVVRAVILILLVLATGTTLLGLAPGSSDQPAPRMVLTGVLLLTVTVIGAEGWALTRTTQSLRKEVVRELSRSAALLPLGSGEDLLPIAETIGGHRALHLGADGRVHTSDGSAIPPEAGGLPTPPPAFPATGRLASTREIYLVTRVPSGRLALLLPEEPVHRITIAVLAGGLVFTLGLVAWLRSGPIPRPIPEPEPELILR